jgi:predicted Zn-dependent peptidase
LEKAMEASVAKLASSGPTSDELSRAKKGLLVQLSSSLQLLNGGAGDAGRAGVLQKLNHYLGDPGRLPSEMLKLQAVEPAEVQRRMQAYMAPQQRVVVVTLPKPAASTDEKPAAGEKGKAP